MNNQIGEEEAMNHYDSITIVKSQLNYEEWKDYLLKTFPERIPYENTEGNFQLSTLTGRFIGIPSDELSYFFELQEVTHSAGVYFLSEILKKQTVESNLPVHQVLEKGQGFTGLSIKRLVGSLEKAGLTPKHHNPAMENLLRNSLIEVLEKLKANYPQAYAHPEFNQISEDLLIWINQYLMPWIAKEDIEIRMPRIIWYGESTNSHLYFLYFAMLIGCDVLIFNPDGKDPFSEIDPEEEVSFSHWFPESLKKQPLQKEISYRSETVAYRSSRQLQDVLQQEGTPIYKPWQFNDHIPNALTLKTTYDELFLIAKEKAFVRPDFHAGMEEITIPNVFAQVTGMSKNKKEYWNRIHRLMEIEQTRVLRHFPFSTEEDIDYTVYYREVLNNKGVIDPEMLRRSTIWLYGHLPINRQRAIAAAIARICKIPKLVAMPSESIEDVKLYLFTQATNLSEEGLKWIQVFDYAQTVPKLLLFHSEDSGILSRSDAAKLLLLNEIGFDIIIYNPPGYASVEQYIEKEAYDMHMLDEMAFGQKFKNPSLFRKSFGG